MSQGGQHRSDDMHELLVWARDQGICSAAAWSVGDAAGERSGGVVGTRSWDGAPVTRSDLFDLASVTKPIVGIVAMALVERGALTLESTVGDVLPSFQDTSKAGLVLRDLMTHTSGMPGQVPMYRDHPTRESMLQGLRDLPLRNPQGRAVEYSSQGLMLVGMMAERAAGQSLDILVDRYVAGPAGLASTMYRPGADDLGRCVTTEDCRWRGRPVVGEVHDENSVVLGGVTGHAGMFSTVDDMAALARALLANLDTHTLLRPDTFAAMIAESTSHLGAARGLSWQCPNPGWNGSSEPGGSPAGDLVGPETFGHTGFTGTSLFVDPRLGRYFVLLTNRVHPRREAVGIEELRRKFHNLAVVTD